MLREMSGEATDIQVLAVTDQQDAEVEKLADKTIVVNDADSPFTNDFHLAFQYNMFAQVLAVKKSLDLGITPANPSPRGPINSVEQVVTIHSFNQLFLYRVSLTIHTMNYKKKVSDIIKF